MAEDPSKSRRSRAEKTLEAIDGDDEFSVSSVRPDPRKPAMALKPKLDELPLPKTVQAPTRERNLFIRLYAKIFR